MRRQQRLRAHEDFRRVRGRGRSWSHPLLVLFAAPGTSPDARARIGVSAGRRVGGAVVRNRARRRVREAVRLCYHRIEPGWDFIFVVRPAAVGSTFRAIELAVTTLLSRAGLLRVETSCSGSP